MPRTATSGLAIIRCHLTRNGDAEPICAFNRANLPRLTRIPEATDPRALAAQGWLMGAELTTRPIDSSALGGTRSAEVTGTRA